MSYWKSLPPNILSRIDIMKSITMVRKHKEDINKEIRRRHHPILKYIDEDIINSVKKTTSSSSIHYCDMVSIFLDLENNRNSIERLEKGLHVKVSYNQDGEMGIEVDDESHDLIEQLVMGCHSLYESVTSLTPIAIENSFFYWDRIYNYIGIHLCKQCFSIYKCLLGPEYHLVDEKIISSSFPSPIIDSNMEPYTGQSYWDLLPNDIKREIMYWKCIAEVRDKSRSYLLDIKEKNHDLILDNYWIEYQWKQPRNSIDNYDRQRYWDNHEYKHCEFNQLEDFDWDQGIPAFNLDTDLGVELYKEIFCLPETWVCTYGANEGPDIIRHDAWLSYDISHDYRGYKVCIYCYRNAIATEKRVQEKEETRKRLNQPYVPPDDYVSILRHDNGDYLEGEIQPSGYCYCEGEKQDTFDCDKCARDYCQYRSKLHLASCRKEIRMKGTLIRQVFVARLKYNQRNNLPLDTAIEDYRIPNDSLYDGVLEEYLF